MSASHSGNTSYDSFNVSGTANEIVKMDTSLTAQWVTGSAFYLAVDTLLNVYTTKGISTATNFGPFTETPSGYGIVMAKIGQPTVGMGNKTMQANNLQVYPNPSDNGLYNLKVGTHIKNSSTVNLKLYDVMGKLVAELPQTKIDATTLQVDLSTYDNGSYIIKAVIDGVNYTAKVDK